MALERKARFLQHLPSGALQDSSVYGAPKRGRAPETMTCDYCCQERDRLWLYTYRGFGLAALVQGKRLDYKPGIWAACVFCRPLHEAHDPRALAARVHAINASMAAADLERLYGVLLQCLTGESGYWESGQPIQPLPRPWCCARHAALGYDDGLCAGDPPGMP